MEAKRSTKVQGAHFENRGGVRHSSGHKTSPFKLLLIGLVAAASFVLYTTPSWGDAISDSFLRPSLEQRADRILKRTPLIDGHNDLPILIRQAFGNHIYGDDFKQAFENGSFPGQFDLKRAREGRYSGSFWSAFWLCQKDIFDFSDEAYEPIVRSTLRQLDLMQRLLEHWAPPFPKVPTASAKEAELQHRRHTIISPLIIEGLHQIGNSPSILRQYHRLGVRYATLNWNCHNVFSDAAVLTFLANGTSVKSDPYWGGISKRGRGLIYEMNRLGMIVDLSHVSPDTMRDVLVGRHNHDAPHSDVEGGWDGSLAPPIFSHSSAHAICPHPRNVPDDVLHMVKQRNSLVMVNFNPDFISCTEPKPGSPANQLPDLYARNNTLEHVADHIIYIGNLIGFAHVGIGSDYDGIEDVPKGMEDVSKFPKLVAELLRRGVSDKDAAKVVGGNLLRVWHEVDRVSLELQRKGRLPMEDELEGLAESEELAGAGAKPIEDSTGQL